MYLVCLRQQEGQIFLHGLSKFLRLYSMLHKRNQLELLVPISSMFSPSISFPPTHTHAFDRVFAFCERARQLLGPVKEGN